MAPWKSARQIFICNCWSFGSRRFPTKRFCLFLFFSYYNLRNALDRHTFHSETLLLDTLSNFHCISFIHLFQDQNLTNQVQTEKSKSVIKHGQNCRTKVRLSCNRISGITLPGFHPSCLSLSSSRSSCMYPFHSSCKSLIWIILSLINQL